MELWSVLRKRKMIRNFDGRPVPRDVVDRVLSAALHAPSAGFSQGNEYLVIDEPDALATYWRLTDEPEVTSLHIPLLVLPLANADAYVRRYSEPDKLAAGLNTRDAWRVPYWDVDASMAVMLMTLAAINEGL